MTSVPLSGDVTPAAIQPLDISRHLGGVADLMEICFGADLDGSGRALVREMRLFSRVRPLGFLLKIFGARLSPWPWGLGFVWVENGRVVGTVSTQRSGAPTTTWLIANVAVHPQYRRRGIGLALMRATLDFISRQGGTHAILLVDDDNPGAIRLYRQLGFECVTVRTLWVRRSRLPPPPPQAAPFEIRRRTNSEWTAQLALAQQVRPEGLFWNQPLHADDFRPRLRQRVERFLSGQLEEHWIAMPYNSGSPNSPLLGCLSLLTATADGDRLTLLVHPQGAGQVERPLLARGLRRLAGRIWPAYIDHPADDENTAAVLRDFGFQPRRTRRWMQKKL